MTTCSSCGARLSPTDLVCSFCKAPTAAGIAQQGAAAQQAAQQAAYQAAHHAQTAQAAQASLSRSATQALIWSVVGVVLCCIPVPTIVGIVLATRARGAAKAQGVAVPPHASIALAISALTLVGLAGFTAFAMTDARRVSREKEQLRKIGEAAVQAELTQTTACALVHLYLLEDKHRGVSGNLVQDFECAGKLTQTSERAELHDVHFRGSSTGQPIVVAGCLKRGARWLVAELRADGSCEAPTPGASPSAQAAPPATAPQRKRDSGGR